MEGSRVKPEGVSNYIWKVLKALKSLSFVSVDIWKNRESEEQTVIYNSYGWIAMKLSALCY